MTNTWFVYIDWTLEETPRPFYVGKGTESRVRDMSRNAFHDNVARKHGISRRIILETDREEFAYNYEVQMIAEHHTFIDDPFYNGIGTNFSTGGDGGWTPSNETRQKISDSTKKAMKLLPPKSLSHRLALSKSLTGRKMSDEARHNMRVAAKGRIPWNKGKTWSNPKRSEVMKAKQFHITDDHKRALARGREKYYERFLKPISCYTLDGVFTREFLSIREARCWVSSQGFKTTCHINNCLQGKRTQAYGHTWRYSDIRPS